MRPQGWPAAASSFTFFQRKECKERKERKRKDKINTNGEREQRVEGTLEVVCQRISKSADKTGIH